MLRTVSMDAPAGEAALGEQVTESDPEHGDDDRRVERRAERDRERVPDPGRDAEPFNQSAGPSVVMLDSVCRASLRSASWWGGSLDDPRPGHPPVVVGDDHVTELLGLLGVVGHEQRRNARRDDHLADQRSQLPAHLQVERGERLVEQHQRRVAGEAARERHSLALTARERAGRRSAKILGADSFEPGAGDRTPFVVRPLA
jgi:hypothetical protein